MSGKQGGGGLLRFTAPRKAGCYCEVMGVKLSQLSVTMTPCPPGVVMTLTHEGAGAEPTLGCPHRCPLFS